MPDQEGLASFAARLQAAMAAAGNVAPAVTDGLGFWNRPPGLALLSAVFLATLAVAAVILWGLWEGEISAFAPTRPRPSWCCCRSPWAGGFGGPGNVGAPC